MAEELTLVGALDEANRWVRALRAAEKLESVIAVVLRAETLVADSERALREFDTKIDAKRAEHNTALAKLTDTEQRVEVEHARLAQVKADADRAIALSAATRANAERETAARIEELANRVAEAEARARREQVALAEATENLIVIRDKIAADIDALRRSVAGVGA